MKEFNLEKAKAGAPVCTRNGDKARIVCFDMKDKDGYHILALIDYGGEEVTASYLDNGQSCPDPTEIRGQDLFMVTVKHEGWVVLNKRNNRLVGACIHHTPSSAMNEAEECAMMDGESIGNYTAAHIEWEE